MRILGLIPARAGSKGIPNKNQKLLNGKPLLQYTIEAALGAKTLTRTVFSSENEGLRQLAKGLGCEVPFKRPSALAQDVSGTLEVVQHALKSLADLGETYDAVCLLQVTNPFRIAHFIDEAVAQFEKSDTDSLISVLKVPQEFNPHWVFEVSENGNLQLATGDTEIIKRRQDLPTAYYRDGSIYITKTEVILKQNSLYGKTIGFIESNPERHVNIDTVADWNKAVALAEKLRL